MRSTIGRYGINGIVFTLLGPSMFWLLYPFGAIAAWLITESSCQLLRYLSFRYIVFPRGKGYMVSPIRYISATIPTSLLGLIFVALMKPVLGRTALAICATAITAAFGYIINRYFYQQQ